MILPCTGNEDYTIRIRVSIPSKVKLIHYRQTLSFSRQPALVNVFGEPLYRVIDLGKQRRLAALRHRAAALVGHPQLVVNTQGAVPPMVYRTGFDSVIRSL